VAASARQGRGVLPSRSVVAPPLPPAIEEKGASHRRRLASCRSRADRKT
jgi:hypothetical protein